MLLFKGGVLIYAEHCICVCVYTYTYTNTLTGHFIRYTLLVPCWTPFCLQNSPNSSWLRFNKVNIGKIPQRFWSILTWEHDAVAADFFGCTSMMQISRSTASQSALLDWDLVTGGHFSKVNSLSCSRNQSKMIWALWHGALSYWK